MEIVLASGNRNKYLEMKEAFTDIGVELLFGGDFDNILEVEETGASYEENAILKASAWSAATGLAAIADDSGLEVEALQGAPGIYSARIVPGSDKDRTEWLLKNIEGIRDRRARFISCIAVVFNDGNKPLVCHGICEGNISYSPVGSSGFGYDPIFLPLGHDKTFAQLGDNVKKEISHRALAIKGIVKMLIPVLQYYAVRTMENTRLKRGIC